jgi:two-component system response regulator (stage 0 sporulation protein F)
MATQPPLMLVVDDQVGVRRLIQAVFQEVGYQVVTAGHGQEALALAAGRRPDLVLLDMKMPVMDGPDTLRAMQRLYPGLPVVIMTAVGDGDRVSEVLAHGARSVIAKPFDVFQLRQMVQAILEGGTA